MDKWEWVVLCVVTGLIAAALIALFVLRVSPVGRLTW